MEIDVLRYSDNGDSTLGLLFIDGEFECYTLEDEYRLVKLKGETRIPEGKYEVEFRKVLSPLTEKYRDTFPWFKWHLEVQDVPNFSYVYIHVGNDEKDTDACLLVGDGANNNSLKRGFISESRNAYTRFYKKVSEALNNGEQVTIHYRWKKELLS